MLPTTHISSSLLLNQIVSCSGWQDAEPDAFLDRPESMTLVISLGQVLKMASPAADETEKLAAAISSLELKKELDLTKVPPHRSHDPTYNRKRADPFKFGSRYLENGDDVFEFNAWDHVETDEAYENFAKQQYEVQRNSPVSDWDKHRFNSDPAKWWNLFYKNNTANFFKDRKWLQQEFPILAEVTKEDAGPTVLLEIGAGAGNTAFPILATNKNPQLKVYACDFSKQAVEVMRCNEAYDPKFIQADVWDVASDGLPPGLEEGTVDVAVLVFIFSALSPLQWKKAVENVHRVLKPGGQVLFRDYGRGDLAQVRFKKGRYLDENFYIRGDGTRVYFFEKNELESIWSGNTEEYADETSVQQDVAQVKFIIENLGVDRRLLVNRARKLKMHRCWLQGRFRKV